MRQLFSVAPSYMCASHITPFPLPLESVFFFYHSLRGSTSIPLGIRTPGSGFASGYTWHFPRLLTSTGRRRLGSCVLRRYRISKRLWRRRGD